MKIPEDFNFDPNKKISEVINELINKIGDNIIALQLIYKGKVVPYDMTLNDLKINPKNLTFMATHVVTPEFNIHLEREIKNVREVKLIRYRDDKTQEWYLKGSIKRVWETLEGYKEEDLDFDNPMTYITFNDDIKDFIISFEINNKIINNFENWNNFISLLVEEDLYFKEDTIDWKNIKRFNFTQSKT